MPTWGAGEVLHPGCFPEWARVAFPPVGQIEAFLIAGGVSTAPWSFKDKWKPYQLKVLRYPGPFAQLKAFSDLGLFDPNPIQVNGCQVSPRRVFHALFEPQVRAEVIKDICLIRAHGVGRKHGRPAEATIDLVDRYDPETGFTAMERTTGWHLSIVASLIAHGQVSPGAIPLELAVSGHAFVDEAKKRGFDITTSLEISD